MNNDYCKCGRPAVDVLLGVGGLCEEASEFFEATDSMVKWTIWWETHPLVRKEVQEGPPNVYDDNYHSHKQGHGLAAWSHHHEKGT